MNKNVIKDMKLSRQPQQATKLVVELLIHKLYPTICSINSKLQNCEKDVNETILVKIRDVYTLSSDQIKKCVITLFDIFKLEYKQDLLLQESRQCTLERLSWCLEKLLSIERYLDNTEELNDSNNSILISSMYFVNWIDQTFDILSKLSVVVYKTDCKKSEILFKEWKHELLACVSGLHTSIDELLLSAMTLCKYCLPLDQLVVKARCQVVLRNTKALLGDIIDGNLDSVFQATVDKLKLPIMPSNINVLIEVLKDVLYVLETNTNTALLALVVHCFSHNMPPAEKLKSHFQAKQTGTCSCIHNSNYVENCSYVKEFDLYNERLLQIGSFAVSCSSDQNRILSLRSSLASLEALDPHLVPAVMLSPDDHHTNILINTWSQEVLEIKNNIFLIVDPSAFADKAKQMMHQKLLELIQENVYKNEDICTIINIGCVVYDFFNVYNEFEPDALTHQDKLMPLLADLRKVHTECKIVSNLLASGDDFFYNTNASRKKEASLDQLLKRLKLSYTLVNRMNSLLRPKDDDDQLLETCDEDLHVDKNMTHTVYVKTSDTYINSPKKMTNVSRSFFARSTNIRCSTGKFPLTKLTKNLKVKNFQELSFSFQLDALCDMTVDKGKVKNRELSILYHSPMKTRSSLRKAVLNRQCMVSLDKNLEVEEPTENNACGGTVVFDKDDLLDETTSLQITEVLNQINDLTNITTSRQQNFNTKALAQHNRMNIYHTAIEESKDNVLTLSINYNDEEFKKVWNIPVNESSIKINKTYTTVNMSQPSNVNTLERINDLDLVESKLNNLKSIQFETSL